MSDREKETTEAEESKSEAVKKNMVVRVTCKSSLNGTRCRILQAADDGSARVVVLEGPQKGNETTVYAGDYEAA